MSRRVIMDHHNTTRRREWLAAALGGIVGWGCARSHRVEGRTSKVKVVEFNDAGERVAVVETEKVVKTEDEWKQLLTPHQFHVTRQKGTERAFGGEYWNNHEEGIYRCRCCGNALFRSDTKFESGSSFWAPIAQENIRDESDTSAFMVRTETLCRKCDAHLGHVFDDSPPPTGLRYCMNSESLRFVKKA